ncbi:hypothetical protein VZT92_002603 [Zoarces viviparus]|uniref:Ig-like domain-containing protein n=1 Tax=Zoarces viviparus TaxID=48416 RepID=A0AAW1FZA8_ZOAVI
MDGLHIVLVALLGVASCSHDWISGSVLEATVRPGDNITLYCDCKLSSGVHIVWYRNCSHENQPSLVLSTKDYQKIPPRFHFVRNFSSESYDLLIMNITDSDEGLYYCGTEQQTVEDAKYFNSKTVYRYGNISTRILFNSSSDPSGWNENPVLVESLMVFSPAVTILSSVISFILVYHFCLKTDKQSQTDTKGQRRRDQDEDACFSRAVFRAQDGQTHQ